MPRKINIPELSGMPEKAAARFIGWLAIEKATIQSECEPELAMLEIEWETWNTKPEAERIEINTKLAFKDKKTVPWPLEWKQEFFDERRCEFARLACLCSKTDIWQLRQVHSSLSEPHWSDVQTMTAAWEQGERVRRRERRVDCTRKIAERILVRRQHEPETGGFEFKEHYPATFGPEGGEWGAEWEKAWHGLGDDERAAVRKAWEVEEKLLPVFYEFARQSPKVLQWAVMVEIIARWEKRVVKPREELYKSQRAWPMHPLQEVERKFHDEMRGRIGGFSDGLVALAKYLVKDTPFALIPLVDRKRAALHVLNCNQSHRHFGPWLSDAGEVSDPLAAKMVQRDHLRLARLNEATQKVKIPYGVRYIFGEGWSESAEKKVFAIPDASLAVKIESGEVIGAAANVAGETECNEVIRATTEESLRHTRQEKMTVLPLREIGDDGSEVLALRVVWKDTRDADLRDEFEKLLKKLRPRKSKDEDPPNCWPQKEYPEREERAGTKESDAKAALNALIKIRKRQAAVIKHLKAKQNLARAETAWFDCQKPGKSKVREREKIERKFAEAVTTEAMAKQRISDLCVKGELLSLAARQYVRITGDDSLPWWKRGQKSGKSK